MGATKSSLMPCNKSTFSVGGNVIKCTELLPVEFTVGDYHTTQPIYICHKIDRIYPDKAAYIDVHILHKSFPQPVNHPVAAIQSNEPKSKTTNPVKRTPPSTKPSKIRFAPTNENMPKLKHYLLEKFSSSAFSRYATFPAMATHQHIYICNPKPCHTPDIHQYLFHITGKALSKKASMIKTWDEESSNLLTTIHQLNGVAQC